MNQFNQNAQLQNNNENRGQALDWNDEIVQDSSYVELAPGEYGFTVINVEKSRFNGSEKLAPCPQAIVHCKISTTYGDIVIQSNINLNTKTEWLISAFFTSIGLKKKGEKLRMDWASAIGRSGRCKIGNREYQGKIYNEIKSFLPAEDKSASNGFDFAPGRF